MNVWDFLKQIFKGFNIVYRCVESIIGIWLCHNSYIYIYIIGE